MGLRSWRTSSQEIEAFPVTWIHSQDKYVNGRQRSPSSERRVWSSASQGQAGSWTPLSRCSLEGELPAWTCPGTGLPSLEEPVCGYLGYRVGWWPEVETPVNQTVSSLEQLRARVELWSFFKERHLYAVAGLPSALILDPEQIQKVSVFPFDCFHKTWPWLIQPWRCSVGVVHLSAAKWIKSLG